MTEATHFADGETGRERSGRVQVGDARVRGPRTGHCDNQSSSADSVLSVGHSMWWIFVFDQKKSTTNNTKFLLTFWGKKIHTWALLFLQSFL